MKEVYFTQRLIAYLVDFIIIGLVSTLLVSGVSVLLPNDDKYEQASESFITEYEKVLKSNDVKEMTNFFNNQKDNLYIIEKSSILIYAFDIILYAAYYGAFQFYNGGQTLGKKLTKIKVVGNKKKDEYNYKSSLLRTAFNYGIFSKLLLILILLICNSSNYMIPLYTVEGIAMIFNLVLVIMIAFRKDGRSIVDMICHTKVVSSK